MKKTLGDTGAKEKIGVDYFQKARNSDPIEAYGIKEFQNRIEIERKKKNRRQKPIKNS